MIRGTTPTHTFDTSISLVDAEVVWVTYRQGDIKLVKEKDDCEITDETLTTRLTQEETLMFKPVGYKAKVQIRARFPDETAVASNISEISVLPILKDGVI